MLARTRALVGASSDPAGGTAVTPLIRPAPAAVRRESAVTKYFDLRAAHSYGPLRVRASPGSRSDRLVRSVSSRLVTSASARWFSSGLDSVLARVGPMPSSSSPPLGPMPVTRPATSTR